MTLGRIVNKIRSGISDWKFARMPNEEFWHTLHNGLKIKLNKNNYGDFFYYSEKSNMDLMKFIRKETKEGECVFDIGAQKGYITINLAKAVGSSGKVFTFEPDPRSFKLLEGNIKENHFGNCRAFNFALSDKNGIAEFNLTKTLGWSSLFPNKTAEKDAAEKVRVETRTIDSLMNDGKITVKRADFVKIDCEGAELLVLQGMRSFLEKYHPMFWIEINKCSLEASKTKLSEIYDFLVKRKYHLFLPVLSRDLLFRKKLTFTEIKDLSNFINDCYDILALPAGKEINF